MSIIRLLQPSTRIEGKIVYKGRDLLKLSEEEMRKIRGKEIAVILQNPTTSLNPVLKVGDQIAEAIRLHHGLNKRAAGGKAIEMLESVKIPSPEKRANEYPHEFSGGMKERAMIAMGLACDPSLIIADEPTSSLDVSVQAQILNLIEDLKREFHLTLLFISHDLEVVRHISDRIAVMYLGKIVEMGNTNEILGYERHPYTNELVSPVSEDHVIVEGNIKNGSNYPSGCVFYPRCPFAAEICKEKEPEMVELGKGHLVACHNLFDLT
ncbi:MAG: ABC transporter ATP-binding protein [Halobacteriota archaeon]